jgi:hypothetical protein
MSIRAAIRAERLLRDYYAETVAHEAARAGIRSDTATILPARRDGPLMPILAAAAVLVFAVSAMFFNLPTGSLGETFSRVEETHGISRSLEETLTAIGTYFRNEHQNGGDV